MGRKRIARDSEKIRFCESILMVHFTGSVNNKSDVDYFLDQYYEEAVEKYVELFREATEEP